MTGGMPGCLWIEATDVLSDVRSDSPLSLAIRTAMKTNRQRVSSGISSSKKMEPLLGATINVGGKTRSLYEVNTIGHDMRKFILHSQTVE